MGRVTFYLLKEDADGNVILDRDINSSNLSATKDGAPFGATFTSNGDGTYYFAPNGSGIYSVLLNGTTQDEFRDVYIPDTDSLVETDVDGTSIQLNGQGKLEVINGDSLLYQADIVDNLLSTSVIAPLSANQGRILSGSIALKQDADTTVLREEDIINDFTTGGADKVQSAQSMLLDLSGTSFLSSQTSYNAALRELDSRISLTNIGGIYKSFLPFGYEAAWSNGGGAKELYTIDHTANTRGYKMPRAGTVIGMSVLFDVTSYTRAGSGDEYLIKFLTYLNGSLFGAVTVEVDITTAQIYGSSATSPQATFSIGDSLTVYMSHQQGIGDSFTLDNVTCLIEIRS